MSTPGVKVGVSEEAPVPAEKIAVLQGGPIAP